MSKIQAIRGMHDILPEHTPVWQYLERTVADVARGYGYQEIRFPVVEYTGLFKRAIGEVTDIVEKEMYTFDDRSGESLTLRPEGTACCVRAAEQGGLLFNQSQRLWYSGPMFRYERPQKGRQRQFHQIGLEAFGMDGPDIDAEIILLTARLWRQLGLADAVSLQLNTNGTLEERLRFREALEAYLQQHREALDEDSKRRLETNPLRILDSKSEQTQALLCGAPGLHDFLGDESRAFFDRLQAQLRAAGLAFEVNPGLVRGLDYYNHTVFEWVTDRLGAQGTVCGGGRYDGLVEMLGGRPTPAVGCAMGMERLVLLLEACGSIPGDVQPAPHAYLLVAGAQAELQAPALAERLRDAIPGLALNVNCGGGSFKSQMKKADRSGAAFALILGEDECARGEVAVKPLRGDEPQQSVASSALADWLAARIARA